MAKFEKLFEPLALKQLKLKNRIVKTPYSSTGADKDGFVTEGAINHYEAVAAGGVGLFITESTAIDPLGVSGSPRMAVWDNKYVPGLRQVASAVHKHDCPIIMQLHHAGPAHSTGVYGGQGLIQAQAATPVAPSSLSYEQLPSPRPNLPRGLTIPEIKELVEKFIKGAERAKEARFDGVELHFAFGYLVGSFFSRAWNKRQDEYGGEVKNRARFAFEIAQGIRRRLGKDFLVGVRMCAAEYNSPLGLTFPESQEIARVLEGAEVDYFNVSAYGFGHYEWMMYPEQVLYPEVEEDTRIWAKRVKKGFPLEDGTQAIKKVVSVPVIANGRIAFQRAEKILREGQADLIAFGRALICDPELPRKLKEGRLDDVAPCTACMTCLDAFVRCEHERCRINAGYAKEKEFAITPATKKKRVLVVGAGPAGMEAARVAALRGHEVILYEKDRAFGGLLPIPALLRGTHLEDLPTFIRYLRTQIKKLGVQINLGKQVDAATVEQIKPDAVILAVGGKLTVPSIPGINRKNVMTSLDLDKNVKPYLRLAGPDMVGWIAKFWLPGIGKRVVIMSGIMQAVETAEFLIKLGRKVTILDTQNKWGRGMLEFNRVRLIPWLAKKGAVMLNEVKYEEITDKGVSLITREGERKFIEADTVMVSIPPEPNTALYEALKGKAPEVYLVGDAKEPGQIVDAIESTRRVACGV